MKIDEDRLVKGIPNRKLVGILVVVMFIAIIGTFVSLFQDRITGFATTDTGIVEVGVVAIASVNVLNNVYFGNGSISATPPYTEISTELIDNPNTFNNCTVINGGVDDTGRDCMGLEVENDGTVYINLTMQANKFVTNFFDSPSDVGAAFRFAVLDGNRTKNETNMTIVGYGNAVIGMNNASCQVWGRELLTIRPAGSLTTGAYMNWTTIDHANTSSPYLICGNLSTSDLIDTVTVEFNLTIPGDEPAGTKNLTLTFTATQVT